MVASGQMVADAGAVQMQVQGARASFLWECRSGGLGAIQMAMYCNQRSRARLGLNRCSFASKSLNCTLDSDRDSYVGFCLDGYVWSTCTYILDMLVRYCIAWLIWGGLIMRFCCAGSSPFSRASLLSLTTYHFTDSPTWCQNKNMGIE